MNAATMSGKSRKKFSAGFPKYRAVSSTNLAKAAGPSIISVARDTQITDPDTRKMAIAERPASNQNAMRLDRLNLLNSRISERYGNQQCRTRCRRHEFCARLGLCARCVICGDDIVTLDSFLVSDQSWRQSIYQVRWNMIDWRQD